ncbi:alpha-E domain-containing protein [Citricoccus sp. SGAir0253]|uniref:alpha-E domain-containing protein n=1 Tax=Citricoccus sp. SGAir0253 TaxID=2567881 RepID=UPI0010CD4BBA|nr:alpha-E domain-containing protein [Citricoccus sp. SGAir0253]QCU78086.1 alpha-E domain-containing protein [Citricoccus sp. SGAir0253]
MLSRIAESLFWIGRYVERADGTARILDVHLERLNGAGAEEQETVTRELLTIMGVPQPEEYTLGSLLNTLAFTRSSTHSVSGALGAARENARRARETVSSSLWEALNTTWYGLGQHRRDVVGTYRFCHWVLERTAMIRGLADSTMSHDEAWLFLELGRSLERADMTARMLATRESEALGLSWVTMLRCAGAYESFLRTQRATMGEEHAGEFLLLDRLFPRSVLRALQDAEQCLVSLDPASNRVGFMDDARRIVGDMRSTLEYSTPDQLETSLPIFLHRVQLSCARASEAISAKYFSRGQELSWVGEVS